MKLILIDTPKGQYTLPLIKVAEDRAEYYAEKEGFTMDSMEWTEEIEVVMSSNYEGIDWLLNECDWDDWEDLCTKVNNDIKITDDDFWTTSDGFEIIN